MRGMHRCGAARTQFVCPSRVPAGAPQEVGDARGVDVGVLLDLAHQVRLVGEAGARRVPPVPVDVGAVVPEQPGDLALDDVSLSDGQTHDRHEGPHLCANSAFGISIPSSIGGRILRGVCRYYVSPCSHPSADLGHNLDAFQHCLAFHMFA